MGTISNLVSGAALGEALSYAIGGSAPMVATLWGLLYYHEFRGAGSKAFALVGGMFALYVAAIALVALSTRSTPSTIQIDQ